MLKLKDDVDLKELEKFGFKLKSASKLYPERYEFSRITKSGLEYITVIVETRKIYGSDIEKIYELTIADLVEKVGVIK